MSWGAEDEVMGVFYLVLRAKGKGSIGSLAFLGIGRILVSRVMVMI